MTNGHEYSCLICGAHRPRRRMLKRDLVLVACSQCGLVHQDPVPLVEEAESDYRDSSHYLCEMLRTESEFLKRDRMELNRLVSRGAKGPLLDVGAGAGTMIRSALDIGWEAVAVEISHESAEHLRKTLGIEVHETPLEQARLEPGSFGAVVFSHSLEHVPDPVATLRCAAGTLRPGGMVLVAVPNWNAAKRVATGLEISWIYGHHISYFNRGSLCRALEEAGLKPIETRFGSFGSIDYAFVIALIRAAHLENKFRRFLSLGDRPLEVLLSDDIRVNCPPWRFRAVQRISRGVLRLWPERLLARLGRSEELRVIAVRS